MPIRLVAIALLFACGGCAALHRDLAAKTCRELHDPRCPGDLKPVMTDCAAGDAASCILVCRLNPTEHNCQHPCDRGDAASCFQLASTLSDSLPHPPHGDGTRTDALLEKACDGGVGDACFKRVYFAMTGKLPALPDLVVDWALLKACGKGDPTACFVWGARSFDAGKPVNDLLPWLRSGCGAPESTRSTAETRLLPCSLARCLTDAPDRSEQGRARRDACAVADAQFTFKLAWSSVDQPRLLTRMPWMLDPTTGKSTLSSVPHGAGWFCFKGADGAPLCQRTRGECMETRRDAIEHAAPGTTIGACDRGPPVAACFSGPNGPVCVDERSARCTDVRDRMGQSAPVVLESACLSVGEAF